MITHITKTNLILYLKIARTSRARAQAEAERKYGSEHIVTRTLASEVKDLTVEISGLEASTEDIETLAKTKK